jgi:hypothetical protein
MTGAGDVWFVFCAIQKIQSISASKSKKDKPDNTCTVLRRRPQSGIFCV